MAGPELTTAPRLRRLLAFALAPALASAAFASCSAFADRSPAEEQGRKVWGAYCDQVQNCSFSAFQQVFGGSYEACLRRGLDGQPPGQEAASCSDAELVACVDAIKHQGCPPFDDWTRSPLDSRKLPSPCPQCSPVGPALLEVDGGADAP